MSSAGAIVHFFTAKNVRLLNLMEEQPSILRSNCLSTWLNCLLNTQQTLRCKKRLVNNPSGRLSSERRFSKGFLNFGQKTRVFTLVGTTC